MRAGRAPWILSACVSAALVVATVLPARAAASVIVDAVLVERLPASPPGRLAPALDATLRLGGRFIGFTPEGRSVIELPDGIDVAGARSMLADLQRFPNVTPTSGQSVEEINELVVLFRAGLVPAPLPAAMAGLPVSKHHKPGNWVVLDATVGITAARLQVLSHDPAVRFVEPSYRYHLTGTSPPNDPDWINDHAGLWGLRRIHAAEAWQGVHDSPVVVAVVDTGIALDHSELRGNLWVNDAEDKGAEGTDDDGNGCIDDVHGCDILDGDEPEDTFGHGTRVAGIIGAHGNNGAGTVGVVWRLPLMAVRVFAQPNAGLPEVVEGLTYAVENGARIINASWSGRNQQSLALSDAITRADNAGVLLVASTGNRGSDMEDSLQAEYPAAYTHRNIVAVLATDDLEKAPDGTGRGAVSVDLGAPGSDAQTTSIGNGYVREFGTSFAVPHVSGALALTWAANPALDAQSVRQRVLDGATRLMSLNGLCVTGARLDLRFLEPQGRPAAPTLLGVEPGD